MDYQQFVVVVKDNISLMLSEDTKLEIQTTLKNNGKERVGITFTDQQINISPTIYLEEYYAQFQKGNSLDTITENILGVYREVKFEHSWQINTIQDFDCIRSKVVYKLIHAKENETLLTTMPHLFYLDLAITFYVLFEVDKNGTATIPITHELVRLWQTNVHELHQLARKNTKQLLPATFLPIRVVIEELMGNSCSKEVYEDDMMFVLTNSLRNFGAVCILYENILEQIAGQLGENFYILPSSIHEVIIIPESQSPGREILNEMIVEMNQTQLEVEEVLSDHAYYYDNDKQCLD